MEKEIIIAIIQNLPSLLWFLLVLALSMLLYKPIRHDILPNITTLKAIGMEFSLMSDSISNTIELAEKNPKWSIHISDEEKKQVLNRVKKHLHILKDAQILWIDDLPENNKNEIAMFAQLHVHITKSLSTNDALKQLKSRKAKQFDLIISDMSRDGEALAGLDFLDKYSKYKNKIPFIFYVGTLDKSRPVPVHAFSITNRPDELLHLILDILERKKY